MNKKLMIYVICHKKYNVPSIDFLKGLQVGTVFSNNRFDEMLQDDIGDNISSLNKSYCELTGQYWIWKNMKLDIVGFFHYRRYLRFNNKKSHLPYIIKKTPCIENLINDGYNKGFLNNIFKDYDIVVPYPEKIYKSVYKHYVDAPNHYKKDIDIIITIIKSKYPDMIEAMEKYLKGNFAYFGNIYVMKWELFDKYMTWLFDILSEFDTLKNDAKYNIQGKRVDGYLAERLFGIYLTYIIKNKVKVYYAQKIYYESFDNGIVNYYKHLIINKVLPPGSYRRYIVKLLIKGI